MRWILLSLALMFGVALSQEPAPSPSIGADGGKAQPKHGKQKAKQDQRGTAKAPLVVDILSPKKSEAEAAQDAKDREDKATEARFAFWFNFLLVLFNGILAVSTVLLWFVTRNAANAAVKAAKSAETQAKAFIAIESPKVLTLREHGIKLAETDGPDGRVTTDPVLPGKPLPPYSKIVITIRNVGRSPAPIDTLDIRWDVLKELPASSAYKRWPFGIMLPVNHEHSLAVDGYPVLLDKEKREAIENESMHLWIHGTINYFDILNEPVQSPFRVRWDKKRGFVPEIIGKA